MQNLSKNRLRNLIKLEIKSLMDEDALFKQKRIPGDYDRDVIDFQKSRLSTHDHECDVCAAEKHELDCECDVCSMQRIGIFEDCGCDNSINSYDEESHNHHDDHSSYMARPQLRKIAKYASKLLDMVDENEELEDWQESKIAQMAQMIGDVYHSIEYDEDYEEETSDDDLDLHDLTGMLTTKYI